MRRAACRTAGPPPRFFALAALLAVLASPVSTAARVQAAPDVGGRAPAAAPAADTLRLADLHETAARLDPRSRALSLRERASATRIEGLEASWLPRLALEGSTSYQTEVPEALGGGSGAAVPGLDVPAPPRDRYEAALEVDQLLWDGGRIGRRKSVERATLAERRAATGASLHELRAELDAAFFAALVQQERRAQLRLLIEDLRARRSLVAARVEAGALVPSERAAVDAEIVRARQELDAAETGRLAALHRLSALVGRPVVEGSVLAVPGPPEEADARPDSLPPWSERPEWRRLLEAERRLRAEAGLADAEDAPRASAFLRGAYGRPGLDFFDDAFSPYATVGVRLSWSLFDGGSSGSRGTALRLEAEAMGAEREALGEALRRRADAVRAEIGRLERALVSDDRLVALREQRRETARRRLEEGVLLPADYVERRTELFDARLRARIHRVELAEARARLLRILGRPLPRTTGDGLFAPVEAPIRPLADPATRPPHDDPGRRPTPRPDAPDTRPEPEAEGAPPR